MKKLIIALILLFSLSTSVHLYGQTNPTAQTLPYSQDFSGLAWTSTTYPAGWQGWKISSSPGASFNTGGPASDQTMTASATANVNSASNYNYNGKIGFLNGSSADLTIALAINTTGMNSVQVLYDIMTIRNPYDGSSNTRINEATLQYRVGTSGTWTSLTGIEYQNNTTTQTGTVTTPQNSVTKSITLPSACDNQSVIQLRWVSRQVSGSGSRPSFAVDNVSITGNSILSPSITVNSSMTSFSASIGTSSPQQNYTVSGANLTANVVITPQTNFLISTDSTTGYSNKPITLTQSSGTIPNTQIYVVFHPTSSGSFSDTIAHTSSGATTINLVVTGSTPVPTITTTGTLSPFSTSPGVPSAEQTYTVAGSNLTNDIVITPPSTNFEISQTTGSGFGTSPITLTQTGGTVGTTTIYVRFNPSSAGTFTDTIFNSSTGATTQRMTVSGVSSSGYSFPVAEDFDYPLGSLLTNNGWSAHSGAGSSPVTVSTSGLSYGQYGGSGVGNAVVLTSSGEDVNKQFSTVNSGTIYFAAMIKITALTSAKFDYFLHFYQTSSIFPARFYAKNIGGLIAFGISKGSISSTSDTVFTAYNYSIDSVYLIVVKYDFSVSPNTVSLWVDPNLSKMDPTPTITVSSGSDAGLAGISGIALRQGTAANGLNAVVDGIRITKYWSDIPLPVSLQNFTSNIIGNSVNLKWTTEKEINNSGFVIEKKVKGNWLQIGFTKGAGTINSPTTYNFTDNNLPTGVYSYRLKQIDFNGNFEYFNLNNEVMIKAPTKFNVSQNFPNPFNPITKISYSLPSDGLVEIKIFDIIGREILSQTENKQAGYYDFIFNGEKLSSGLYFYQIRAGDNIAIKKMLLIK